MVADTRLIDFHVTNSGRVTMMLKLPQCEVKYEIKPRPRSAHGHRDGVSDDRR
jgi:hypothetical protein